MGETTLTINANVQGAVTGVNQVNASMDKLNKETDQYNKKASTGFTQTGQAATQASQSVNTVTTSASKAIGVFKALAATMGAVFSVGLVLAWSKAIVTSTGAGQDAMERFNEGSKRAMAALNTALATADFSGLITGLREAWEEGKRYADVLDEIQARQAALGAFKATLETQQAEQKLIARNAENSVEVRQAALDKIVELEKQKLTETLDIQNTELDEALRAAAVRTGISAKDEEQLKARKALVEEWARAYGTIEGVNKLNKDLAAAVELETRLDKLVKVSIDDRGRMNKDLTAYNKALANLTDEEKRILALKEINSTITDEERNNVNKLIETRANSVTQSIEQETSLQRLRNQLMNEFFGNKDKEVKATEEANKKIIESEEDKQKELQDLRDAEIESSKNIGLQRINEFEVGGQAYTAELDFFKNAIQVRNKDIESAEMELRDTVGSSIDEIKAKLIELEQFSQDHPIAAALGFENEEQLNQIKDYAAEIMSFINEMVDQQVEARTRIVEDWNQKIEEQEELVNREQEDKAEGLANNYELEQQNLAKMQKARDQAIKEREKSIKLQRTLSTVESSIALISAAANIIKGFSSIPIVGVVLGIAAVGAMIAGFIAAQGKVADATQMEEGGQVHGLLKGRRHSQGGIPIEAEDGEWFINRNSSMKYSPLLDAINKDDQNGMKLFFDRKFLAKMPKQQFSFDIDKSKKLGEIARNTRSKGGETIIGPGYILERYGGYTKKINLN